jgi:hypothetical protein
LYGFVYDLDPAAIPPNPMTSPVAGLDVKGCIARDTPCSGSGFDHAQTDGDGGFVLDLSKNPYGNSSFFEVTAPTGLGLDYPPHLFFLARWTLTHSLRYPFFIYRPLTVDTIPMRDPTLGGVLFFAFDCSIALHPAAGVEVTANPNSGSSPTRYVPQGYPFDPTARATFPSGIGFIADLEPGPKTLSAIRHDTGEPIGTTQIVIQAGAMTIAELVPTP